MDKIHHSDYKTNLNILLQDPHAFGVCSFLSMYFVRTVEWYCQIACPRLKIL